MAFPSLRRVIRRNGLQSPTKESTDDETKAEKEMLGTGAVGGTNRFLLKVKNMNKKLIQMSKAHRKWRKIDGSDQQMEELDTVVDDSVTEVDVVIENNPQRRVEALTDTRTNPCIDSICKNSEKSPTMESKMEGQSNVDESLNDVCPSTASTSWISIANPLQDIRVAGESCSHKNRNIIVSRKKCRSLPPLLPKLNDSKTKEHDKLVLLFSDLTIESQTKQHQPKERVAKEDVIQSFSHSFQSRATNESSIAIAPSTSASRYERRKLWRSNRLSGLISSILEPVEQNSTVNNINANVMRVSCKQSNNQLPNIVDDEDEESKSGWSTGSDSAPGDFDRESDEYDCIDFEFPHYNNSFTKNTDSSQSSSQYRIPLHNPIIEYTGVIHDRSTPACTNDIVRNNHNQNKQTSSIFTDSWMYPTNDIESFHQMQRNTYTGIPTTKSHTKRCVKEKHGTLFSDSWQYDFLSSESKTGSPQESIYMVEL